MTSANNNLIKRASDLNIICVPSEQRDKFHGHQGPFDDTSSVTLRLEWRMHSRNTRRVLGNRLGLCDIEALRDDGILFEY